MMNLKHGMIISAMLVLVMGCTDQQLLSTLDTANEVFNGEGGVSAALSNDEVIKGLKQALSLGTDNAVGFAGALDGFAQNDRIRIPFPEKAIKVKEIAENLGLGIQIEKFELTLNRAAEQASKEAAPIFLDAITSMSIADGFTILKGDKDAASVYLRSKSYDKLYSTFSPKVETAVAEVRVAENWTPLANAYNTATLLTGGERVDPDLNNYVTTMAIDGLFTLLADEEAKIRENPAARVTDLLKKVFGSVGG